MIFGEVASADAEGAILAHSLRVGSARLKKGTVLGPGEVRSLVDAGVGAVTVLRLEEGDVTENEAALRLAEALCGPGLELSRPFTGRTNLVARQAGIVSVDVDRVNALNRIDEALTVATVNPFETVGAGDLAATVKVIPFAVRGVALARAVAAAGSGTAIGLHPFRPAGVGLLHTELSGTSPRLAQKARSVSEARLAALGSHVAAELRCRHDARPVAAALGRLIGAGADPIIVFAASAVADRLDVVPAAIVAAGGEIIRFGMPVDPGNLLLLGRIGEVTILAAPGSARSPRLHGFDWVLRRVLAGLEVGPDEITAMGVGGLLKEITTRPQPRTQPPGEAKTPPRLTALVLAAGRSARMGGANKLLLEVEGRPMVVHAVEAALASRAREVVVVTGHEADLVSAALGGLDVRIVRNPDFADGLSTSLRAGVEATGHDADGVIVMLGDMPGIGADALNRLVDAFAAGGGGGICVSTSFGKRGNPVVWARRFFPDLLQLKGDVGARHLIGEHDEEVIEVELGDAAALDVDTPEAYTRMTGRETGEQ
jgi:molybdenum cofactor cytidylyltransferase